MRILVVMKNKVLRNWNEQILSADDGPIKLDILDEYLKDQFGVRRISEKEYPEHNVCIVQSVPIHPGYEPDGTIFGAAYRDLSEEDQPIREILESMQKENQRKQREIQTEYGVQDGKIVHISEIPEENKGKNCGCVCPGCGMPLQAKLGKVRRHHFSHNNENCKDALETALHMLAKEIIAEEGKILVPGIVIDWRAVDFPREYDSFRYDLPLKEEGSTGFVKCENVQLEKAIDDIIPDISVVAHGKPLLIEIAVTHFVDAEKAEKIKKIGLPVLEIDLSEWKDRAFDRQAIADAVLNHPENRKWIYNPRREEIQKAKYQDYLEILKKAKQKFDKEQAKEKRKEQEREKRKEEAPKILEKMFLPENYKSRILELRNDQKAIETLKNCDLFEECSGKIPFFMDIPITGEFIFQCDRRIWQIELFRKFVYYHKKPAFAPKNVESYFANRQREIPIDWPIAYKVIVKIQGKEKIFQLIDDVICRYARYLEFLGFLKGNPISGYHIEKSHCIQPPNPENAEKLKAILESIDLFAPDVDECIDPILKSFQKK